LFQNNMKKFRLETCFSPAAYSKYADSENIVVIVDILRATSAICTAFEHGVKKIIPVSSLDEARKKKEEGYMVASERDGKVLDFADFGNSPFNFTRERVDGKEIVYSTTNGTRCINMSCNSKAVVVGSYLNLSALSNWLISQKCPVLIFCSSWKDRFSLEDTVFAGALAEKLLSSGVFESICDSVTASVDLWSLAKPDVYGYIKKAAQKSRLAGNGLDDCIEFCHQPDYTSIIPVYKDGSLVPLKFDKEK